MNKNFMYFSIIGIILLAAGIGWYGNQQTASISEPAKQEIPASNQQPAAEQQVVKKTAGYTGEVLAGKNSPYLVFNKADYDKALADGKIIFLDFYANWCPICRAEAPEITAGFDSLTTNEIVGFRINFNDDATDADEKALAKQFSVSYQHTKVILKNGKVVLKDGDQWDRERFAEEIQAISQL